jgi:hypothetical protein
MNVCLYTKAITMVWAQAVTSTGPEYKVYGQLYKYGWSQTKTSAWNEKENTQVEDQDQDGKKMSRNTSYGRK